MVDFRADAAFLAKQLQQHLPLPGVGALQGAAYSGAAWEYGAGNFLSELDKAHPAAEHRGHGGEDVTLFRKEDWLEWTVFTVVFFVLILFDNFVLHRNNEVLSFKKAMAYTCFWLLCAAGFNVYIYFSFGSDAAFDWCTGYLLEWMLSVDNLFVFHMVFSLYGTPDHLKHKPLFWGIVGAIFFRMLFFVIEEYLFHAVPFMHLVFGAFLIYTGIKAGTADDEDEDPTNNPLVIWVSQRFPILNGYDDGGAFFVKVPIDPKTGEAILPKVRMHVTREASESEHIVSESGKTGDSTPDKTPRQVPVYDSDWYIDKNIAGTAKEPCGFKSETDEKRYETRATLLFLVVICLEITDIIFAVDSVSAIVAQIPDLYLAYTACVFAMLGLRATFFVIDELIRMFTLLKYGVAFILIFIGVKLIVSKMVHIPPMIVCGILVGTISICMIGSYLKDRMAKDQQAARPAD